MKATVRGYIGRWMFRTLGLREIILSIDDAINSEHKRTSDLLSKVKGLETRLLRLEGRGNAKAS